MFVIMDFDKMLLSGNLHGLFPLRFDVEIAKPHVALKEDMNALTITR